MQYKVVNEVYYVKQRVSNPMRSERRKGGPFPKKKKKKKKLRINFIGFLKQQLFN